MNNRNTFFLQNKLIGLTSKHSLTHNFVCTSNKARVLSYYTNRLFHQDTASSFPLQKTLYLLALADEIPMPRLRNQTQGLWELRGRTRFCIHRAGQKKKKKKKTSRRPETKKKHCVRYDKKSISFGSLFLKSLK